MIPGDMPQPDDESTIPTGVLTVMVVEEDRESGLLRLVLDSGEELELNPNAPEAKGLSVGQVLDAGLHSKLEEAAARKQIARRTFHYLDRRRYSRSRLREKLAEAGHAVELVDQVLDQFAREGLVDDADYARAWIHDQLLRKPVGPLWLLSRLKREGISREDAQRGIDLAYPRTEEGELARQALERKRLDLSEEKQRAKAQRFLSSRGFSSRAILGAIRELRA